MVDRLYGDDAMEMETETGASEEKKDDQKEDHELSEEKLKALIDSIDQLSVKELKKYLLQMVHRNYIFLSLPPRNEFVSFNGQGCDLNNESFVEKGEMKALLRSRLELELEKFSK